MTNSSTGGGGSSPWVPPQKRWPDLNDPKWHAVLRPENQRKLLAHDIEQYDPKQCYCKTLESYLVAIGWRRV